MDLSMILESFYSKMTKIYLYQRAMKDIAKKEFEAIERFEKAVEEKPKLKDLSMSYQNMFFHRADDGEIVFFGQEKLSIEDKRLSIILHKNKQYQWLLAEAYEEFEDCLIHLYAYAGYSDHKFWLMRDFGDIRLDELPGKSFEWFCDQAKKLRESNLSIINRFRNTFNKLKQIETNNHFGINLYLAVTLIENLRHIIVHCGGVVSDLDVFKKKVLKKCGLINNGKPSRENLGFIDCFFGIDKYANTIMLLEAKCDPESIPGLHLDVFKIPIDFLISYIYEIYKCLEKSNLSIEKSY